MTTVKSWGGAGLSAGAFTTGGSGSAGTGDDPFDGIASSSVITVVASGGRSPRLQHAQGASVACAHYWNITATATVGGRFYYTSPSSLPGSSWIVLRLQGSSGTVLNARIDIGSSGDVRIRNGSAQQSASATGIITTSTTYRFEWTLTSTGSSSGVFTVRVFPGDSGTYSAEVTATADFGTNTDRVWFGNGNTSPQVGACFFDDFAVTNTASWIGPAVVPPTVSAGGDQTVQDYHAASIDATVTGNTGTTTYAWTVASGPSTSSGQFSATNTVDTTFTAAGGPGTYVLQLAVTDDSGTTTDTCVVTVTALQATDTVAAVTTATSWTASAGTVLACLSDGDPGTYITSSNNPSSLDLKVTMRGIVPPTGDLVVTLLGLVRSGGTGSVDVSLYKPDGSTLVKKISSVTAPTSATDTQVTFLAADISGVTSANWRAGCVLLVEATAA